MFWLKLGGGDNFILPDSSLIQAGGSTEAWSGKLDSGTSGHGLLTMVET